jgi:DNA-binding protein H-NS
MVRGFTFENFSQGAIMDLSRLSLADLRALQQQVTQELKVREQQELEKAREQIIAIAQSVGIPLKELIGTDVRGKPGNGSSAATRFRHPANRSLRWSGRGRQPKWVKDWVASGQPLDALRA